MPFKNVNVTGGNPVVIQSNIRQEGKGIFSTISNAKNDSLAKLNEAKKQFLKSMLHDDDSESASVNQNKNMASQQDKLKTDRPVVKVPDPVEKIENKDISHDRLKQKLKFLAADYQEKLNSDQEQLTFFAGNKLSHQPGGKKVISVESNSAQNADKIKVNRQEASVVSHLPDTSSQLVTNKNSVDNKGVTLSKAPGSIDAFMEGMKNIKISSARKLGGGDYGTAYKYGDFVVKIPVNQYGHLIDWNSEYFIGAQLPEVTKLLNKVNGDNFARAGEVKHNGKTLPVLVTKFVDGKPITKGATEQVEKDLVALDTMLKAAGLHLYDALSEGNVMRTAEDKLVIVDGDLLVESEEARLKPDYKPSMRTIKVDEQQKNKFAMKLHNAKADLAEALEDKANTDKMDVTGLAEIEEEIADIKNDIDYYSQMLKETDRLIKTNDYVIKSLEFKTELAEALEKKIDPKVIKEIKDDIKTYESKLEACRLRKQRESLDIEGFIKGLGKVKFNEENKLGSGSHGTAYRMGDFVIKVPVNERGEAVEWTSGMLRNANPARVSRYLNQANADMNFSRAAVININGTKTEVLVSKYIEGTPVGPEEFDKADQQLHDWGLHMHDINVHGNVLKTKDDEYYFVDADQLVGFSPVLRERRPSETTVALEEGLTSMLAFKHHQATMKNDTDELEILKYEIEAFENATGRTVQKRA